MLNFRSCQSWRLGAPNKSRCKYTVLYMIVNRHLTNFEAQFLKILNRNFKSLWQHFKNSVHRPNHRPKVKSQAKSQKRSLQPYLA